MPGDFKRYSIDNYDKLTRGDFYRLLEIKDRNNRRLEIIRFLAKEAKEEECAKDTNEIKDNIGKAVTFQDAFEHCKKLKKIGIIRQTRSEKRSAYHGPAKVDKYYIAVEDVLEILAILDAALLGLRGEGAKKIKKALTRIVNQSKGILFTGGIYGAILDMQEQILDSIRDIAHNYNNAQKDIINSWYEVAQSNVRHYYYPWFYSQDFVDITLKAYRSMADYAISGLNIAQNNLDGYIDMSKTYSGLVADNINEISRMVVNSSKVFQPTPQPSILTRGEGTTTTTTLHDDVEDNDKYDLSEWIKLILDLTEIVQIALSSA